MNITNIKPRNKGLAYIFHTYRY